MDETNSYSCYIRSTKIDNSSMVTVARSRVVDGEVVSEEATLYPYMYDATLFEFSDNSGNDYTASDAMKFLTLGIEESCGEVRKSISFNMGTWESEDGTDRWNEKIFYSSTLTKSQDGLFSIAVYIPTKSTNGEEEIGFNDSVVSLTVSAGVDMEGFSSIRSNLPPVIVMGTPHKKDQDEEDPVFPSSADRVEIGKDTISSYYSNSRGYSSDYLFTNSGPVYEVEASGFLPKGLGLAFSEIESNLVDEITTMETPLDVTSASMTEEFPSISIGYGDDVVTYNAEVDAYRFTTEIDYSELGIHPKKTFANSVRISGKVKEV